MSGQDKSLTDASIYAYEPSHILPAVFAALIGLSLVLHIIQNLSVLTRFDFAIGLLTLSQPLQILEGHVLHDMGRLGVFHWMGPSMPFII